MRAVQPKGKRGSLKWIQALVNQRPDLLDRLVRESCGLKPDEAIEWVSPLADDEYAEYRDASFLRRLGVELGHRPLREFWPRFGPQWDALGRTDQGAVFLVEAKANIPELVSPASGAKSPTSIALIDDSLKQVQRFLRVDTGIDWSGKLYQYANRIAHLYLLRELNRIPAYLLFIYFIGDRDVDGPQTTEEWKAAIEVAERVLGLPTRHRLRDYVVDIFVHVSDLPAPATETGKIHRLGEPIDQ